MKEAKKLGEREKGGARERWGKKNREREGERKGEREKESKGERKCVSASDSLGRRSDSMLADHAPLCQ